MEQSNHNCETCGAPLPTRFDSARMATCDHCGTTSVLQDGVFRKAGHGGELHEGPMLLDIGARVEVDGNTLLPVGHAQFDYGRGYWDEFWCLDDLASGWWLSADEGAYALERELPESEWPRRFTPRLGATTEIRGRPFLVTEAESATCLAVRGEFPEVLSVGETHLYYDLSSPDGGIATYERWDGGEGWSLGRWIDPWKVVRP